MLQHRAVEIVTKHRFTQTLDEDPTVVTAGPIEGPPDDPYGWHWRTDREVDELGLTPPFYTGLAISRYRQNAFASCMCRGVLHSGSNTGGAATKTQMHLARDVATFKRLAL
jgi:hypothetical protein